MTNRKVGTEAKLEALGKEVKQLRKAQKEALTLAAERAQALFEELIGTGTLNLEILEEGAPDLWDEVTAVKAELKQTDVAALKAAVRRADSVLDELVGADILAEDLIQSMSPQTWDEIVETMEDLRAAGL